MVWYSHLLKNFPQFVMIHMVKVFHIVSKAEAGVFLELSCFQMTEKLQTQTREFQSTPTPPVVTVSHPTGHLSQLRSRAGTSQGTNRACRFRWLSLLAPLVPGSHSGFSRHASWGSSGL